MRRRSGITLDTGAPASPAAAALAARRTAAERFAELDAAKAYLSESQYNAKHAEILAAI